MIRLLCCIQTSPSYSLVNQGDAGENSTEKNDTDIEEGAPEVDTEVDPDDDIQLPEGGKKDPFLRRQELLVNSGLAEVCF